METIEIRPATRDDAAQIIDIQHAAYQIEAERYDDHRLPPLVETVDDLLASFSTCTILAARRSAMAAASASDPIVGAVRARVVDDTAHIARLAVAPALHGRGIGRQLLMAIERAVAPVGRYELFTGDRSTRNLRMYERAGYRTQRTERQSDTVSLTFMDKPGS